MSNKGDIEYLTDIKLGGLKFSVQIDTGRCGAKYASMRYVSP